MLSDQANKPGSMGVGVPAGQRKAPPLPNQAVDALVVIRSPRRHHVAPQLPDQEGKPLVFYTGEWPAHMASGTAQTHPSRTTTQPSSVPTNQPTGMHAPQTRTCPTSETPAVPQLAVQNLGGTGVTMSGTMLNTHISGENGVGGAKAHGTAIRGAAASGHGRLVLQGTVPYMDDTVLQAPWGQSSTTGGTAPKKGGFAVQERLIDWAKGTNEFVRSKSKEKGAEHAAGGPHVQERRAREPKQAPPVPRGVASRLLPELAANDSLAELERLIRRQHQQVLPMLICCFTTACTSMLEMTWQHFCVLVHTYFLSLCILFFPFSA